MDTNQPEPERLQQPIALDNTDFPLESHITAATLSSQSEPSEKAKDERSMSSPSKETYDRGSLSNLEAAQEMEDDLSSFDPDSPAMKRVRRKVDFRLMPLLGLFYLCSFLDRVNIGNAKVAGLETDINIQPWVYNLSISIFYIGYIIGEIPANLALKKLGPRLWIPFVMLAWGIVSMSMAAVTNGSGLLASRFFLGLAESGYAPAPVYIISLWYRRNEQALRIGFFYSASMIAGAFGGLVAYVIGKLHNLGGLTGWQWIFIIEGLPTIFSALVAFWVLPDFPETSTFLSPEERNLLIQNIRMDVGPATDRKLTWKRFCATFRDWKIYAFAFTAMLHSVTFASLGVFVPSITLGFGFEPVTTQLMTAPIYLIACVFTLSMAFSSDRHKERGLHATCTSTVAATGYFLLVMTRESSVTARYISLVICACGVFGYVPTLLSWSSSNFGGHTKKAVGIAFVISVGQCGSVIGGQIYRQDDAPLYARGHAMSAGFSALLAISTLTVRLLLRRENRRRDNLTPEQYALECEQDKATDRHPDFRYYE